jgi:hypothetical protein
VILVTTQEIQALYWKVRLHTSQLKAREDLETRAALADEKKRLAIALYYHPHFANEVWAG